MSKSAFYPRVRFQVAAELAASQQELASVEQELASEAARQRQAFEDASAALLQERTAQARRGARREPQDASLLRVSNALMHYTD